MKQSLFSDFSSFSLIHIHFHISRRFFFRCFLFLYLNSRQNGLTWLYAPVQTCVCFYRLSTPVVAQTIWLLNTFLNRDEIKILLCKNEFISFDLLLIWRFATQNSFSYHLLQRNKKQRQKLKTNRIVGEIIDPQASYRQQ